MQRKTTPKRNIDDIIIKSGRRCAICYGLHNKSDIKKGQVAHLDKNPANTKVENLVFLCLDHHDGYDSSTSQSKGFTINEVTHYREDLYKFIAERKLQNKTNSQNHEKRKVLLEVIGDMVPDVLMFLNMPAREYAEKINEIKKLHKRFEKIRPIFHDDRNIQKALTVLGNIVGSTISQQFTSTYVVFENFDKQVDILKNAFRSI